MNVLASLLQLAAIVGLCVAAFLVWLPLGVFVVSVAVGAVGVAIDPTFGRRAAK